MFSSGGGAHEYAVEFGTKPDPAADPPGTPTAAGPDRSGRGRSRRRLRRHRPAQKERGARRCSSTGPRKARVQESAEGWTTTPLQVNVPEVDVDVGVLLEKTGQFVPGLKPDNFRVYENGVEQKVIGFKRVEAPITALLLCEFASTNYYFVYDMRNAAWSFAQQLRPQDYVAMMTFDMRTQIVTDFTQDKRQLYNAINSLIIPGFSERNLFDALYEAEDRLTRIEGRKYIILIASGRDTMSRITLDKILQKVKNTPDVTIFAISTGGAMRAMTEGRAGMNAADARSGLSAGRQPDEDLRENDRRHVVQSALRRRNARHFLLHQPGHPLKIRAHLPSQRRQDGRHLSQASG